MTDVFISYSHEDHAQIRILADALKEDGLEVWYDRNIGAGERIDVEIEAAVKSARCIIVAWSANSVTSQWVRSEAHEGLDRDILVPILLENERPPLPFGQIQSANFYSPPLSEKSDFSELLKAVRHVLASGSRGSSVLHTEKIGISRDPGMKSSLKPVWSVSIVLLSLLVLWLYFQSGIGRLPSSSEQPVESYSELGFAERDWIVLASFENFTENLIYAEALDAAFRIGLSQSSYTNILSLNQIRSTLERMQLPPQTRLTRKTASEIALRERAKAVVVGSISQAGEAYSISSEIIEPTGGKKVFSSSIGPLEEGQILGALGTMCEELRAELGESIAQIEEHSLALEKVTTQDFEALKAYSIAVQKVADGLIAEAIRLLEWALDRDPEFAMAYATLGSVHSGTQDNEALSLEYWNKALSIENRLTDRERLHLQALNKVNETPEEMIQAWKLLINLYPDQSAALNNLGLVYLLYVNRFEDAAKYFARAVQVKDSWNYLSWQALGAAYLGLGEYSLAQDAYQRALELAPGHVPANWADLYMATRLYDKAEEVLEHENVGATPALRTIAQGHWIGYFADRGQFRESVAKAAELEAQALALGMTGEALRSAAAALAALELLGDDEAFSAAYDRVLALAFEALAREIHLKSPPSVSRLALLGKIGARNGKIDQAKAVLSRLPTEAVSNGFFFPNATASVLRAEIQLASGHPELALEEIHKVLVVNDLFQAHETLARIYVSTGSTDAALTELEWLQAQRGRAFGETMSNFFGKEFNLSDWARSWYERGRLLEESGDSAQALASYRKLLDHWRDADEELPLLVELRSRISRLEESTSGVASLP
jgi:putative peptide modification system cyclase